MKTCARLTGGIALILAKLPDASPLETPDKGSLLRRAILDGLRASRPMQSFRIPANFSPELPAIPSATYVGKIPSYYSALFVSSTADGHMKFVIFPVFYLCRERIRLINRLVQFQHFHSIAGAVSANRSMFPNPNHCRAPTLQNRKRSASLAACHTTASPSGSLPNAGSSIPSDVVVSSRGQPSSSSVSVVVSIKHGRPLRS